MEHDRGILSAHLGVAGHERLRNAGWQHQSSNWCLEEEACAFADEANHHVYVDQNLEWAATHVTQTSLQQNGQERLRYFFEDTKNRLGRAREISQAKATVSMRFSTPFNIESSARVIATAETDNGPAEVYAMLRDGGDGWQIDRMWWRFLPLSEPWRSAR